MIIKKGKFYYYYLENEEITFKFNNWETPFGTEEFGKKTILNLTIPKNNEGLNLKCIISQICDEIKKEFDEYAKSPIKPNGLTELVRCEIKKTLVIEKNSNISGTINFKIYNFKGNWGIICLIN